jgi:uronate dehydrogenase
MQVVCLRIGSFRPLPETSRQLRTWLSPRDGIHLVERSLDAPNVEFIVVYGVSDNTDNTWTLEGGARQIGYEPRDDASTSAIDLDRLRQTYHPADKFHGGVFTLPTYKAGTW